MIRLQSIVLSVLFSVGNVLAEDTRIVEKEIKHLKHFEVPTELFGEEGYIPIVYLNSYKTRTRQLHLEELRKLYILVASCYNESLVRMGQDYHINSESDLYKLLVMNTHLPQKFPANSEVKMLDVVKALRQTMSNGSKKSTQSP